MGSGGCGGWGSGGCRCTPQMHVPLQAVQLPFVQQAEPTPLALLLSRYRTVALRLLLKLLAPPPWLYALSSLVHARTLQPHPHPAAPPCRCPHASVPLQKWTPSQDAAVLLLAIAMYHELRPEEVGNRSAAT